jgi:branched-chain amino acid transport system substrate-binding protein
MDTTKPLKLGWLIPYSSTFRNLKRDLQDGLQTALRQEGCETRIEAYPEFIQTGAQKPTEEALKKLVRYEQVDLVAGVLSSKVALNLLPTLEAGRTPLILMNLGADIPVTSLRSGLLLYNSLHLWKSQWSLGRWAQARFGGEPSVNMSLYESGYGLHESFKAGIAVSGASTLKLNLLREQSAVADITPLIAFIEEQRPAYAHVLLSGQEGLAFLRAFRKAGLDAAVPLTTSPFLTTPAGHDELPAGLSVYSAATWHPGLDSTGNQVFREAYRRDTGETPNVFGLLAYETGLVLAKALRESPRKASGVELSALLAHSSAGGPRGTISLGTDPLRTANPVYIWSSTASDEKTDLTILEQCAGVEWNEPSLTADYYITGWQNPYLCA